MSQKKTAITAALSVAQGVYDALQRAVKPGATELDLQAEVNLAANGHPVCFDLLSGPRTADVEGGATQRVLARGDALLLDLCLQKDGYWCDVCRTYFVGEARPATQAAYRAVLDCFTLLKENLRHGVSACALYDMAKRLLAARGLAGWMRHHTGHGIGQTPFEAPVEVAASKDVLCVGDAVTVEIGVYQKDSFGIRLEDDFWVTEHGAIDLWDYPMQLEDIILPFEAP